MKKIKTFIKVEISGWKPLEIGWLIFGTAVILGLSIYWKENAVGIISAVTGVMCVILTGKGKVSSFLFGTINTLAYAYIAFGAKYYGEVMLNLLYYFPCNFIGIYAWLKHSDSQTNEVIKKRLSLKSSFIVYPLTAVGVVVYGFILKKMGNTLPFFDAASTVFSVMAQILCIKRYAEQWVLWIIIDVITVVMWGYQFFTSGESIATLFMWIIYLVNAVIMFVRWEKDVKKV